MRHSWDIQSKRNEGTSNEENEVSAVSWLVEKGLEPKTYADG